MEVIRSSETPIDFHRTTLWESQTQHNVTSFKEVFKQCNESVNQNY